MNIIIVKILYSKNTLIKFTHLFKCKTSCVSEIAALSFEQWMWLVSNDKDNVGWNFSLCLIALFLKRNLCPTLPPWLHWYAHILVLFLRRAIGLQDTSRYFHLFHTTMINFLQRHVLEKSKGKNCIFGENRVSSQSDTSVLNTAWLWFIFEIIQ